MKLTHLEDVATTIGPLMDGFGAPWCIAGGWAIDLFLGRVTRAHADVELAVFRQDQSRLRSWFEGWALVVSVGGNREAWPEGRALELPVHEIHASSRDRPPQSLEFLLNERDTLNWVFRRDPSIVLPLDRAIVHSELGLPVLSPEIVLLFKAKSPRPKDEADFLATLDALGRSGKQWLRASLAVADPAHPWLRSLAE